jgi:hypothetical protein
MAESGSEPTISAIRRKLISAAPAESADARSESVDFDQFSDGSENGLTSGLEQFLKPQSTNGHASHGGDDDDVDALLHRYQVEKGLGHVESAPPPPAVHQETRSGNGHLTGSQRLGPAASKGLPPLTKTGRSEVQRLESENAELKQLINEYREVLEANDPTVWEQKVAAAEQAVGEKDAQFQAIQKQIAEWEEKFKTHRFVPHDNELAKEADEIDKERAKLVQERKEVEAERDQLKEDEDAMMKQMREMEVGMAKDRAELARQRTELQRIHAEIKQEMEQLERGDGSMKERLAQFQRRYQDAVTRPGGMPMPSSSAAAPLAPQQYEPTQVARPKDTVFKKFFGK